MAVTDAPPNSEQDRMSTTCDAKSVEPGEQFVDMPQMASFGQTVSFVGAQPPLLPPVEPVPVLALESPPDVVLDPELPLLLPEAEEEAAPPDPPAPERPAAVLLPQSSPHPCCSPEIPLSGELAWKQPAEASSNQGRNGRTRLTVTIWRLPERKVKTECRSNATQRRSLTQTGPCSMKSPQWTAVLPSSACARCRPQR
jgi:hypothetical protein